MISRFASSVVPALAAALLIAAPANAAGANKVTLDAFSVWSGGSEVVQIGPNRLAMVGVIEGPMFVETDGGPLEIGSVACPATIEVDSTRAQKGTGHCAFTADDGATAFGDWNCSGMLLDGCLGKFKVTGGTGRLATIQGTSDILFLAHSHDFDDVRTTTASHVATGITIWPAMTVSLRKALSGK